jgi:HEAT repeat protein
MNAELGTEKRGFDPRAHLVIMSLEILKEVAAMTLPRFTIFSLAFVMLAPLGMVRAEDLVGGKTKNDWMKMLRDDESPRKREAAVIALGIIGPKVTGVKDSLRDALARDKAERVRLKAIEVVQNFEKESLRDFVPTLAELLKGDAVPAVRAAAATALGKAGEYAKGVVPIIVAAFKDKELSVRTAAADSIGRIGFEAKDVVKPLVALLKDPDAGVRLAATFSLGRIGLEATSAIPELMEVLAQDSDANIRKEAARAFGFLGPDAREAVPTLVKALREDKSESVRQQCALSLAKVGSEVKKAVPGLLEALQKDPDRTVRVYSIHALSNGLGGDLKAHIKPLTDQLLKDPEGEVRLAIVQELGALGPDGKEALPALQRAASDIQVSVRNAAKEAIKKITTKPEPEPKKD